jgi:hypothetical protein
LLGNPLDFILTFQVKRTGSGSDKTMRHLQNNLGASTRGALCDRRTLDTIAFTQRQYLFSGEFKTHMCHAFL